MEGAAQSPSASEITFSMAYPTKAGSLIQVWYSSLCINNYHDLSSSPPIALMALSNTRASIGALRFLSYITADRCLYRSVPMLFVWFLFNIMARASLAPFHHATRISQHLGYIAPSCSKTCPHHNVGSNYCKMMMLMMMMRVFYFKI